ncbi:MAG TPA: hypothetical protein VJU86_19620 [Pyrinomonadaceae bacterium]|nr:hypothetical protein [Pyrinomonadaceae bacterium]
MSAKTLRLLGILFLVAAAVVSIMNLKRVANLGVMWVPAVLLVVGIALLANARRRG